jgi:hypothetical protein
MLPVLRRVISPPYCGLPSVSHQLPDTVVGLVVVIVVEVGLDVDVDVMVEIGVEVDVALDVVVDLAQDAKTSDVTMRKVNTIQKAPLFIHSSYF